MPHMVCQTTVGAKPRCSLKCSLTPSHFCDQRGATEVALIDGALIDGALIDGALTDGEPLDAADFDGALSPVG